MWLGLLLRHLLYAYQFYLQNYIMLCHEQEKTLLQLLNEMSLQLPLPIHLFAYSLIC